MNCSSMSSLNRCAVLHRLLCGDLLRYGPSWAAVKSMLHHGFPAGWREIPALAPGMPPNPPPPLHLAVSLIFFFPSLSSPLPVHFFPFLKYISQRNPQFVGGAQLFPAVGWLELTVSGTEQLQVLLTDSTPANPPLPAPCHTNPMQCINGLLYLFHVTN